MLKRHAILLTICSSVLLTGCDQVESARQKVMPATPAERCASSSTYASLRNVLVRKLADSKDYAAKIEKNVSFKDPIVEANDRDTGRVDCSATMSIVQLGLVGDINRLAAENFPYDPDGLMPPYLCMDQTHVEVRITYVLKRLADGGGETLLINNVEGLTKYLPGHSEPDKPHWKPRSPDTKVDYVVCR